MVEKDFFTKNYKKSENHGHSEFFFRSRKKDYDCKIFKSFFFITKASIWALVDRCFMKKAQIQDILTFYFISIRK